MLLKFLFLYSIFFVFLFIDLYIVWYGDVLIKFIEVLYEIKVIVNNKYVEIIIMIFERYVLSLLIFKLFKVIFFINVWLLFLNIYYIF